MKVKKNSGFVGADIVIAILAVTIFATLILTMMYNNVIENVKIKKETLAMIYITEIFEKIGTESYENVTEGNINNFVSEEVRNQYLVDISVTEQLQGVQNNEGILKKVNITLTYEVASRKYSCSMQRMKSKE